MANIHPDRYPSNEDFIGIERVRLAWQKDASGQESK
jgi:hypothetical protein